MANTQAIETCDAEDRGFGTLGGAARPRSASAGPKAIVPRSSAKKRMTVGQRWRLRRNLVIYQAHTKGGLSQRLLADVFDLPRARVQAILAEMRALDPNAREDLDR